jgi:hypothetical protein
MTIEKRAITPSRKKIKGFYLAERIGEGGMSEVFLGINPQTRERRAYKVLGKCAFLGPSTYARFMREVDIIRDLSHPGIFRILDSGVLEDRYYYSMEYMPGGNLGRRLEHGKIPMDLAMGIFLSVCAAMAYAHESGVIHQALKPSNILFNTKGEPVVSDFGIAKVLNFEKMFLLPSGEIMGRIAYLAPEQRFSSKKVNRRADVYALGAILYEMLMGFPPLGDFPKPVEANPDFPEPLQSILVKCLAMNPEERFENAGQLQLELENCSNAPISGVMRPIPAAAQAKKTFAMGRVISIPPVKADRIESWFGVLRTGSTRERLAVVREMADKILPSESNAVVKLYPEEGDRVRWGLMRVLGELKIEVATPIILNDLRNSFNMKCAMEALGKIGSDGAFIAIRDYISEHPESALIGLLPLARTGKHKAIKCIRPYLSHETANLRQAAVQALASIRSAESLQILKERLCIECDEKVSSGLLQAVHSLREVLFPDSAPVQQIGSIPHASIPS